MRVDPSGQVYDDSWVDEFEADYVGHRLYALGSINEGASWASIGLNTALDIAGSLLGIDIFESVQVLASGRGGFWNALDIVARANPVGRLGAVGRVLFKAREHRQRSSVSLRVLQEYCFAAGTPVLMEDGGFVPIEWLKPGDDPFSIPDPLAPAEPETTIVPERWRIIHLEMDDANCQTASISLLRPVEWLEVELEAPTLDLTAGPLMETPSEASLHASDEKLLTDEAVGATFTLSMPEMGLDGPARIVRVEPCPANLAGSATGIVTGTFVREAPETLSLYIDALSQPIGVTPSHPFWSLDRQGWIAAGDLLIGETLATLDGPTAVVNIEHHCSTQTVYNLEVCWDHTYFVSDGTLWVHNAYVTPSQSLWRKFSRDHGRAPDVYRQRFESAKKQAGLRPGHRTKVEDQVGDIICDEEGHEMFGQIIGNVLD